MTPYQAFALGVLVGISVRELLAFVGEVDARLTRLEFRGIVAKLTATDSPTPKRAEG